MEQGVSYYTNNSQWGERNLAVESGGATLERGEGATDARWGGVTLAGERGGM